ncbi:hypothetical protein QLH52_05880 [Methylomonas sp. OY6]|uniref:Uncharacterized protein n=1 Tax=Methylomonas defluvii TaxID=3045149 RepID=A0ABU4UBH8_9GAMM|nr:hypothetical protein [Methylomonas sp. OY6]MDX8126802.1 hypothetical protein [Methylomonas sp. OY6]
MDGKAVGKSRKSLDRNWKGWLKRAGFNNKPTHCRPSAIRTNKDLNPPFWAIFARERP